MEIPQKLLALLKQAVGHPLRSRLSSLSKAEEKILTISPSFPFSPPSSVAKNVLGLLLQQHTVFIENV